MNKIKICSIGLIGIFGFSGCVNNLSLGTSKSYYYYPNSVADCESRNMVPFIGQNGSLFCKSSYDSEQERLYFDKLNNEATKQGLSYVEYFNKKRDEEVRREQELNFAKQKAFLNKIAQYEIDYLNEYEEIKKQIPEQKIAWVQPKNKKESCRVYVGCYDKNPTEDTSYKLFWDGECKDGYAYGLGREIEKANLKDDWQIGIYEKGMATGGYIQKDNLHNVLIEGEANYCGSQYAVVRRVFEENRDINLVYESGSSGSENEPALTITTSPFWNQTQVYRKTYPNFRYEFANFRNNDEQSIDFLFSLFDKNNKRHGWAIEKNRNQNIQIAEYINGNGQIITLPKGYNEKADRIINEISQASNKALYAQNQAQLVKKQYLRKICRESIKIDFMDNEEYKEICEDKAEKELMAKVDAKLQKINQEKIAKLEQQRYTTQQQKEEQYRQQQLSLERQRLEAQQRQAKATEEAAGAAADRANWDRVNNTINNINHNLQMQQINHTLKYGY